MRTLRWMKVVHRLMPERKKINVHSRNVINVEGEKAVVRVLPLVPAASFCSFKHFLTNENQTESSLQSQTWTNWPTETKHERSVRFACSEELFLWTYSDLNPHLRGRDPAQPLSRYRPVSHWRHDQPVHPPVKCPTPDNFSLWRWSAWEKKKKKKRNWEQNLLPSRASVPQHSEAGKATSNYLAQHNCAFKYTFVAWINLSICLLTVKQKKKNFIWYEVGHFIW